MFVAGSLEFWGGGRVEGEDRTGLLACEVETRSQLGRTMQSGWRLPE